MAATNTTCKIFDRSLTRIYYFIQPSYGDVAQHTEQLLREVDRCYIELQTQAHLIPQSLDLTIATKKVLAVTDSNLKAIPVRLEIRLERGAPIGQSIRFGAFAFHEGIMLIAHYMAKGEESLFNSLEGPPYCQDSVHETSLQALTSSFTYYFGESKMYYGEADGIVSFSSVEERLRDEAANFLGIRFDPEMHTTGQYFHDSGSMRVSFDKNVLDIIAVLETKFASDLTVGAFFGEQLPMLCLFRLKIEKSIGEVRKKVNHLRNDMDAIEDIERSDTSLRQIRGMRKQDVDLSQLSASLVMNLHRMQGEIVNVHANTANVKALLELSSRVSELQTCFDGNSGVRVAQYDAVLKHAEGYLKWIEAQLGSLRSSAQRLEAEWNYETTILLGVLSVLQLFGTLHDLFSSVAALNDRASAYRLITAILLTAIYMALLFSRNRHHLYKSHG